MSIYNPKRRTESGTEEIKFPISTIKEFQTTADDNGKVLTVVEGSPAWKDKYSEGLSYYISGATESAYCIGIGTCTDTDIVIPPTYNGYPVTEIDREAFRYTSITSVVVPNSVTTIRFGAFSYVEGELRTVVIPSSVTTVEGFIVHSNRNVTVYCEAEAQPDTWDATWNSEKRPVIWDYADNFPAVNDKINDVNGKTVDKVFALDTYFSGAQDIDTTNGITWADQFGFLDESDNPIQTGTILHNVPIEAGENVTFSNEGDVVKINASGGGTEVVTTTGTGAAYVAEVPSITELTAGVEFTMIPHTVSTSASPTLNVNGLGAKGLRRQSVSSTSVYTGYYSNWLGASKPYRVVYNGTYWIVTDLPKTLAADLSSRVPTSLGGVPSSTSSNAGQVLTVNSSGTPEWAAPSSSGGSSGLPAEYFPMFAQALGNPLHRDGVDTVLYSTDDFCDDYGVFSSDCINFDSLCRMTVTSNSSQFDLEIYNDTIFYLYIYVYVSWSEQQTESRSSYKSAIIQPKESATIIVYGEEEMVDDSSWEYNIEGARFGLNGYL